MMERNSADIKPLCEKAQAIVEGKINTFTTTDEKTLWELAELHFKHTVLATYFFPLFDSDIKTVEYVLELASMSADDRDKMTLNTQIAWFDWHILMVHKEAEWITHNWLTRCVYNYMVWKLTGKLKYGEVIEWEPNNANL